MLNKINTKRLFWFGAIVAAPFVIFNLSRFTNGLAFIATAALITVVAYGVCWIINRFTKYKILSDGMNVFIVAGQAIDGIASAIAIAFFGFGEQHVVSNIIIGISPALFAAIKILIAVMICWSLDDYIKSEEKEGKKNKEKLASRKNLVGFIKVIIAILGFATGLASLFKLGII